MLPECRWSEQEVWAPGRLQLYVDDPALVAWGTAAQRALSFSLAVLLWLVLGVPLSWTKGAVHPAEAVHRWIGVCFTSPAPGVARMSLPEPFIEGVMVLCRAFLSAGRLPLRKADSLVGKAGRVAYVLPHTRPFIHTLYAALAASLRAKAAGARETAPTDVACRRFRHGAGMLLRILSFKDRQAPIPHSRDVFARELPTPDPAKRRIEVDASPWGGGGVLVIHGKPVRCFCCTWEAGEFQGLGVEVGSSASQTFFEILVLVLAIELWARSARPTAVLGDNVAALQEAISMKGKGIHAPLSQALAVLIVSRTLHLSAGHLPSEANEAADSLSRQAEPGNLKSWPFAPDQHVIQDVPLSPSALWAWIK